MNAVQDEILPRSDVSVLVVDDDPDIRFTFRDVLESEGFTVATAANGTDALHKLHTLRPAVILLDLSMPEMSGEEFRERQLRDPRLAEIPTVVISASGSIREIVSRIGVDDWLEKPVELDALINTVARFSRPS